MKSFHRGRGCDIGGIVSKSIVNHYGGGKDTDFFPDTQINDDILCVLCFVVLEKQLQF